MPRFKLTLTRTAKGERNGIPVEARQDDALAVARKNHVTGPNGEPIEKKHIQSKPHGAIWIVQGESSNVDNMIKKWEEFGNVTVEKVEL